MDLLTKEDLLKVFKDQRIAIIGSAPSVLRNVGTGIDGYDLVIRINNYKIKGIDLKNRPYDYRAHVGTRIDYHYSFYGGSIRTTRDELVGIKGHLCKCPNAECHITDWHKERHQEQGGDFRPIYRRRHDFWVAPVYIPDLDHYMKIFKMLGDHVPTTGFACIWELMQCEPKLLYITGFDFMTSGKHNVDEMWNPGKLDDPIRHLPDKEAELLKKWAYKNNMFRLDNHLRNMLYGNR